MQLVNEHLNFFLLMFADLLHLKLLETFLDRLLSYKVQTISIVFPPAAYALKLNYLDFSVLDAKVSLSFSF
jgi:hypothetical protein